MKIGKRLSGHFLIPLILLGVSSCNILLETPVESEPSDDQSDTVDPTGTPDIDTCPEQKTCQWAFEAVASSEYENPEWGALQAIGRPDTTDRCGDYQTAWASAASDSEVWLEVKFPFAVYVTGVNIFQSFNPNQVKMVELVGPLDRSIEIYMGDPVQVNLPCPYKFPIEIDKTGSKYDTVRIWVDQSVLGLGRNQIDAVQLVGETH